MRGSMKFAAASAALSALIAIAPAAADPHPTTSRYRSDCHAATGARRCRLGGHCQALAVEASANVRYRNTYRCSARFAGLNRFSQLTLHPRPDTLTPHTS